MENQQNRDDNNNQKGSGNNQSSREPKPGGQQSGVASDQNTNWDKEQRDHQASPRDYNEPSGQGQESREKQQTSQEERDEEERTRQRAATQGGKNPQGNNKQIPKGDGDGGVEGDPGNLEGYGATKRQQSREQENDDMKKNRREE